MVGTAAPVIPNGASTRSVTSCGYGRSAAAASAAPSTAKPRLEYVPGGASSGAAAAASRISGVEYGYGLPAVSVLHQPRTNAPAPPGTDGSPERWVASCSSVTAASGPGTGSSAPTVVVGVTSPRAIMSAKSRPVRPFVIDPISKRVSGAAPSTAVRVLSAVTAATASAGLPGPTTSRASAASSGSPCAGAGQRARRRAHERGDGERHGRAHRHQHRAAGRDVHRGSSHRVVARATSSGTTRSAGTWTCPRPLARSQPAAVSVRMWW